MNNDLIINLNHLYGIVKISGPDPIKFLQGQLTCDLNILFNPSINYKSIFGAYCNIKGRVEYIFWVFKQENNMYIRIEKSLIESFIQELDKYAKFSKIIIEDVSEYFNFYGFINKNPNEYTNFDFLIEYSYINKHGLYELVIKKNQDHLNIYNLNNNLNLWAIELIKHKIPTVDLNTKGLFLPHNIELTKLKAISFTKGCYKGQEIIARMEYKSTIKYKLDLVFDIKKNILPGEYLDNKQGQVISISEGLALVTKLKEIN